MDKLILYKNYLYKPVKTEKYYNIRVFLEFLKSEKGNLFSKYFQYAQNSKNSYNGSIYGHIYYIFTKCQPRYYSLVMFNWDYTLEGSEFWKNIDLRWRQFCGY